MRTPVIALIGRPNVGKSTLFNRITRSRDALVADFPGLTRDRHYGQAVLDQRRFIVIDTGGFEPVAAGGIEAQMAAQARQAMVESDALLLIVDARAGLTPADEAISAELRRRGRPVWVVVNKAEGMPVAATIAEFHRLGWAQVVAVSAAHGEGVRDLFGEVLDALAPAPPPSADDVAVDEAAGDAEAPTADTGTRRSAPPARTRIAIVGRPNVGKSTLINALLGENRVIAFDQPGTTRDAIAIDFDRGERRYTLVDTAGLRRRGRVFEAIEKFSVVKTLQAISDCHVAILLVDATEGVSDQDAHIAGFIVEAGRALVLALNKVERLDSEQRSRLDAEIERKLPFLQFAAKQWISALQPRGLPGLMRAVDAAMRAAFIKLPTPKLTRALQQAIEQQAPPRRGAIRPKPRYAHQGGQNPPVIVIHGNALDRIGDSYRRYLEAWFRDAFGLLGTPVRIELRSGTNPYASERK